jgi:hypothetical protein
MVYFPHCNNFLLLQLLMAPMVPIHFKLRSEFFYLHGIIARIIFLPYHELPLLPKPIPFLVHHCKCMVIQDKITISNSLEWPPQQSNLQLPFRHNT